MDKYFTKKNDNHERKKIQSRVINKEEEIYFQIFDFFKFPNALMTVVAFPDDELVDDAVCTSFPSTDC